MMKLILVTVVLISTLSVWANPLLLKCSINKAQVSFNVDSLIGSGCVTKAFLKSDGEMKKRYNIELCGGVEANGTLEVLANNQWIEVATFSSDGRNSNYCQL